MYIKKLLSQCTKAFHPASVLKINNENNDSQANLILNVARNIRIWPKIFTKSLKSVGSELVHLVH